MWRCVSHVYPSLNLSCKKRLALSIKHATTSLRYFTSTNPLDASIGLNDDDKQVQRLALEFARNEFYEQASSWDINKKLPLHTLRECAALGFGGLYVKDDVGGSAMSRKAASVIFEALATGCISTTAFLTIHNMCAFIIDAFGSEQQRTEILPQLCAMEKCISYCLTEPGSGSDAASLTTSATLSGDEFILNGTKAFISGGGFSDYYLVMARHPGSCGVEDISCFIVPKDASGIHFGAQERKLGWHSQPTSAVILEDCRIPAQNLIGEIGSGFKIAMKALDGGRINIASCSLGGAQRCLDLSMEHICVRKQFGQPLSMLQHLRFKVADMATDIHASRLLVRNAADLIDDNDERATMFSAMAKQYATDACFRVCDEAMQLHGGYGYLADYPIERFLRDSRVNRILEGTNEIMRVIVSRHLLG